MPQPIPATLSVNGTVVRFDAAPYFRGLDPATREIVARRLEAAPRAGSVALTDACSDFDSELDDALKYAERRKLETCLTVDIDALRRWLDEVDR